MKDDAVLLLIKISINLIYCVDDNVYTVEYMACDKLSIGTEKSHLK